MSIFENTVSMLEVLPETDLIKIQDLARKLFQTQEADTPFRQKSKEEIYRDLEVSRRQAVAGEYQEAEEFLAGLREEYEI